MQAAGAGRRKFGTDINRYLGVEFAEDQIIVPQMVRSPLDHSEGSCTNNAQQQARSRPVAHRNQSSNFSFRDSLVRGLSGLGLLSLIRTDSI